MKSALQDYYTKAHKEGILTAIDEQHKGQIDHLASEGILKPVTFRGFDGVIRTANSILTAIDHLRRIGQYKPDQLQSVEWFD
jgi:hypothetical protein